MSNRTCKERINAHWEGRKEDFEAFMNSDDYETEEQGSFYNYGLSIDYVAPETFNDQKEGYLRYQLSWGGPSDEIRFFYNYGANEPYKVEYWFLDWGDGANIDVEHEEVIQWLWEDFNSMGTTNYEYKRAMEI